ncbi:putative RING finger domain-containing protein [Tetraselmis virus 1]|uniref:Putative RING finger domain-containing protein n=1 Tax=Tetraselmis virus 1 TaxID=2060617 RepID=A0A2P0VNP1_9VIRU|nr:putative RING finger domain-containing protein [Tetraselmis virus 1]AUF82528.1 putative RING finger domain-containing protein [Tetraselmis virus 1]
MEMDTTNDENVCTICLSYENPDLQSICCRSGICFECAKKCFFRCPVCDRINDINISKNSYLESVEFTTIEKDDGTIGSIIGYSLNKSNEIVYEVHYTHVMEQCNHLEVLSQSKKFSDRIRTMYDNLLESLCDTNCCDTDLMRRIAQHVVQKNLKILYLRDREIHVGFLYNYVEDPIGNFMFSVRYKDDNYQIISAKDVKRYLYLYYSYLWLILEYDLATLKKGIKINWKK